MWAEPAQCVFQSNLKVVAPPREQKSDPSNDGGSTAEK